MARQQIGLQEFLEFPLHYFYMLQIATQVVGRNKRFFVFDPKEQFIAESNELQQF